MKTDRDTEFIDLSTKDTARGDENYHSPDSLNTLKTSKRGQPLYKGQNS